MIDMMMSMKIRMVAALLTRSHAHDIAVGAELDEHVCLARSGVAMRQLPIRVLPTRPHLSLLPSATHDRIVVLGEAAGHDGAVVLLQAGGGEAV